MVTIRKQQMEVFEREALRKFEDEMVEHLGEFHPPHATAAGEAGLRRMIQIGTERARRYGFTLRGPIRYYLEQMMLYGQDYDTDPLLPWAGHALRTDGADQLDRADQMHAIAWEYHTRAIGPDGEHEQAAIRRLLSKPATEWLSRDVSDVGVEGTLTEVYPEKCEAEPIGVRSLIRVSSHRATEHGLPETGKLVFAALSVALGHGYMNDPVYPWVAGTLRETDGQPAAKRLEKLLKRAIGFLAAVLAEHEKG